MVPADGFGRSFTGLGVSLPGYAGTPARMSYLARGLER